MKGKGFASFQKKKVIFFLDSRQAGIPKKREFVKLGSRIEVTGHGTRTCS
jgi:hypothetical protein